MKDFDRRIRQGGDDAVRAALEYALTVAARWIPVEERLPEIDENVLASMAGEIGIAHRYVDGWFWDVDEWHKPFTPSHWMPLPEPPEVE